MKTNRIISSLLAVGMAFTFTGCGSKDSDPSSSESSSAKYTTAELAEKISIDGVQLKSPMTFADLGSDFNLDSYAQESSSGSMIDIFNDEGIVCTLQYGCSPEEVDENQTIEAILFTPNDFNRDAVSIDGFTANDDVKMIEEKLGKPETEGMYFYETTDGGRLEVIDIAGKVFSINFFFEMPEQK